MMFKLAPEPGAAGATRGHFAETSPHRFDGRPEQIKARPGTIKPAAILPDLKSTGQELESESILPTSSSEASVYHRTSARQRQEHR